MTRAPNVRVYRDQARQFREMALNASSLEVRAEFEKMAVDYDGLAERAEAARRLESKD